MKKYPAEIMRIAILVMVAAVIVPCQAEPKQHVVIKGPYFGQRPPGMEPVVFGDDLSWFKGKSVQDIAVSPDGKEICYVECRGGSSWGNFHIMYTRQDHNGVWSTPEPAPFMGDVANGFRPAFSPDGNRVYFVGEPMQRDIYMSVRLKKVWTKAVKLDFPINSDTIEHSFFVGRDKSVYFCSHREGPSKKCDIFSGVVQGDGFASVKNEEVLNTDGADCGPVVSVDGKYLLFHSTRQGNPDLYVSKKNLKGEWTTPVNMGPRINTSMLEVIPHFSPDGRYIFFTRRENFTTSQPSRLYWVSTKILADY
jgi:Tol biopolymer transport system component